MPIQNRRSLHFFTETLWGGVSLNEGGESEMLKQEEAAVLAEIRRMTDKERKIAVAMLRSINAGKPELPHLKLVVGGRQGGDFGGTFRCG